MGYELHLRRPPTATEPLQLPALEGALRAAGVTGTEGAYTLLAGGARVPVRVARGEGALLGVDLDVPFGAPDEDFRAALLQGAQLAARLQLVTLDPQLGVEVTPDRADASFASWRTANRYAIDTAGVTEDVRRAAPLDLPKSAVSLKTKVMLGAIGVLVVAYLILNWLVTTLLQPGLKPID